MIRLNNRFHSFYKTYKLLTLSTSLRSSIMSSLISLDLIYLKEDFRTWTRPHSTSIASGLASIESNLQNKDSDFSYKSAITALNSLQTNAQYISDAIHKERGSNSCQSLEKTLHFLSLLDIKPEDLNKLNVIHVSGTKGKGSTCAFAESILRQSGYKTGFYSSPHLVAARERIRINGEPLSKDLFAKYFWWVFAKLEETKGENVGMPPYFNFLTLMAFKVFLEENIDVTILEVGIGGEYDCTNVVPKPIVTGVSSLGFDHCSLLGNTIDKIAWQKAGIFKHSVPAFTVQQNEIAMKVLHNRAHEKMCSLHVCPKLSLYPHFAPIELGIKGEVQKLNASLALQLTNFWRNKMVNSSYRTSTLITKSGTFADVFPLNKNYLTGLSKCLWPGRCQVLRKNNIIYFLDGAHTSESMRNCSKWFMDESQKLLTSNKLVRVLVFNCTGGRTAEDILKELDVKFDIAIFCPNRVTNVKDVASDQSNFTVTPQKESEVCSNNAKIWSQFNEKAIIAKQSCISDAIAYIIEKTQKEKALPVHVLVTGSVHLVGGVLGLLDPDINSPKPSTQSSYA